MKWNIQMPNNIEIADFSFIEPMFPATKVHRNDIKLRSDSRNGLMDRLRGGAQTADWRIYNQRNQKYFRILTK